MSAHLLVLQEQNLFLVLWLLLFILFISQIINTVKNKKKKNNLKNVLQATGLVLHTEAVLRKKCHIRDHDKWSLFTRSLSKRLLEVLVCLRSKVLH